MHAPEVIQTLFNAINNFADQSNQRGDASNSKI